jgi:hypothetical protein
MAAGVMDREDGTGAMVAGNARKTESRIVDTTGGERVTIVPDR